MDPPGTDWESDDTGRGHRVPTSPSRTAVRNSSWTLDVTGNLARRKSRAPTQLSTVALEAPDASHWRAQLHALLQRMHRALVDHPGIAATATADPPTTEAALLLTENLLGTLLAGGLNAQDAAWAADIFAALVTYAAIEDDVRRADRHTLADELHAMFTSLPADQFPLVTAHAAQLVAGDGDERFRFAIDVVIDGMLARAARR